MSYQTKQFDQLLGTEGFSDQLLTNHFTLYQGYVKNTNKLADTLEALLKEGKTGTIEFAELKRRFGWEFNGMRLHEYYFDKMAKGGVALRGDAAVAKKIGQRLGSFDQWQQGFKSVGAMRGAGWVVLSYDPSTDRLFNVWIDEHDSGHLMGTTPLLVMDVFEHAFMLEYGLKRADYVNAFFNATDWTVIEKRFNQS